MSDFPGLAEALRGAYEIQEELGEGATAIVYLAGDLKHDRSVALKVLRPELGAAVGAERFVREIRIAGVLNHPNVLPLFDSGETRTIPRFQALLRRVGLPLGGHLAEG